MSEPVIAADERDVDVGGGLCLHVARRGAGPPLVLLHGFTGSTETWAPFHASFNAGYTTIGVDLPGHGRSTAPDEPARYGLGRFADDLARVLDTLVIERIALLGYSMGGRAALRFARRHRDRVAALVLESASPGIADPTRRAERLASDAELADFIEREGLVAFGDRWERLPLWESQRALADDTRIGLRAQREANRPRGLANSLRGAGAGADEPVLDRLSALRMPTLIIAGALDTPYVELGGAMGQALADARLVVVPGAGHAVHLERPQAFVGAVMAFLRDRPSSAGGWR